MLLITNHFAFTKQLSKKFQRAYIYMCLVGIVKSCVLVGTLNVNADDL